MEVISRKEAKSLGLKWYFTGKACPYGHVCKRLVSTFGCFECGVINIRKWRDENRGKANDYSKQYAKDNPEKVKENKRVWQENNKEYLKERRRVYYKENRELILSEGKKWREKNKELKKQKAREYHIRTADERREKSAEWARNNPDKVRVRAANRRAKKRNAEGSHTAEDVSRLYELQRSKCAYCEALLSNGYHCDHIEPLSKGGSNWPENIQLLCVSCNLRKNAKDPYDWAKEIGKLL